MPRWACLASLQLMHPVSIQALRCSEFRKQARACYDGSDDDIDSMPYRRAVGSGWPRRTYATPYICYFQAGDRMFTDIAA